MQLKVANVFLIQLITQSVLRKKSIVGGYIFPLGTLVLHRKISLLIRITRVYISQNKKVRDET